VRPRERVALSPRLGPLPQITQMGCKSSSITRKDIMLKSTRKSVPILMLMSSSLHACGQNEPEQD